MKTYSELLMREFKITGISYIVGNSISSDKLLQLGIEAGKNYSPLDDRDFVRGVFETKDANKIKILLSYTSNVTSEFINEDQLMSDEYLPFILGNRRIGYFSLNKEKLENKIIFDLKSTEENYPKNDLKPTVRNLINNPILDRNLVAKIINGDEPFNHVPLYQRFIIGSESSQVNFIDDSYFGQDSPTSNELYFDEPNIAFFNLIFDNLDAQKSSQLESFFKHINFSLLKLYGSKCFNPHKFIKNQNDEYIEYNQVRKLGSNNIINIILDRISKLNTFENLTNEEFDKSISYLIILSLVLESLYNEDTEIIEILKKQNHWICHGAIFFHNKLKWYEELESYDEMMNESQITPSYDKKYIKQRYKKIRESIPKILNVGSKVGSLLSYRNINVKSNEAQNLLRIFDVEVHYTSRFEINEEKSKIIDYLRISENYKNKSRFILKRMDQEYSNNEIYNMSNKSLKVINNNIEISIIGIVFIIVILIFFKN